MIPHRGHCASARTLVELPEAVVSVAVEGDRWLVVGEQQLHWYRMQAGRLQDNGTWTIPAGLTALRGDWYDVTGDGQPEALITARRERLLSSFILTQDGAGTWRPLATGLGWYLRVLPATPHTAAALLGQQQNDYRPFAGPVLRLHWRDRGLHADGVWPLPRGTAIYHFIPLNHDAVWVAATNGPTRQWRRDERGRWTLHGRLAARLRGISGVALPAPAREFGGGSTPAVVALPLLPLLDGAVAYVPVQRMVLNGVVGRAVTTSGWELMRTSIGPESEAAPPTVHYSGHGQLQQLVPTAGGLAAVIQFGREEWLSTDAVRSAIILVRSIRHPAPSEGSRAQHTAR
ncbi:MAG: VCBS repeat-containing protein [Deltaproteobacteria bacterium]|nr:VCBS repeat-containing protein [Deltaproteobacteria bacterium]